MAFTQPCVLKRRQHIGVQNVSSLLKWEHCWI